MAPAPAEAPAPAATEAPAPAEPEPDAGPTRRELLVKARALRRGAHAEQRKAREAVQPRTEPVVTALARAQHEAANSATPEARVSHTAASYKALVRGTAHKVRSDAALERLTEKDAFERERYASFCARIKGTELEAWIQQTFDAIDVDCDGQVSLYDFELLEGRLDGGMARLFRTIHLTSDVVTRVAWVQFCADLWHVGGQDLVASTLNSFENLVKAREREEVDELREACRKAPLLESSAERPRTVPTLDERVLCVFQGMDFDGNGTIEAEELAELIQNDAVSALILPLLDNDDGGDGKVTPEEFRTFFDVWAVVGDNGVETALVTFESLLRVCDGAMQEAYERKRRELLGIELPVKLPTPRSAAPPPRRDLLKRRPGPALPSRDVAAPSPRASTLPPRDADSAAEAPVSALPPLDLSQQTLADALGSARALFTETPRTPRSSPRRLFARNADASMYTPFKARSRPRRAKPTLAGAGAAIVAASTLTAKFSSIAGS